MLLPPFNLHDLAGLPPLQLLHQRHQQTHLTSNRDDMGRNHEDDDDDGESEEYNINEEDDGEEDDLLERIVEALPHGNHVAVLVSTTISASETTNQNNNLLLHDHPIANGFLPPPAVTTALSAFASLQGGYPRYYPSSPLVESVLDECHRQLGLITSSSALSGTVDGVFAKFWREFNQVVRNHSECHERLIQFLGDFLAIVEGEGRHWFAPRVKLGRELFNRELRYWFDEVANDVLVYLKERDPLDDSALDHPTIKHFVNYFSFLALLTKDFPELRKWIQIFHLPQACLLGRNDTDRPWRDAALLAWEKVIDILGTRAYDEFRDQGWMDWETKAGEIGLEFIRDEARRNTVKQAAERIHLKMRKVREEANAAVMFPSYIFTTNSPFLGWPAVTCRAER